MKHSGKALMCLIIICLLIGAEAKLIHDQSDVAQSDEKTGESIGDVMIDELDPPKNPYSLKDLVIGLQTASVNKNDTDGDGLYDSVEAVLGTDFKNNDSDFDNLNDTYEVYNSLDPLDPDTNRDGLPDYTEVTNVNLDLDNDGIPNAWDFDNDNDGVIDRLDESPFAKSTIHNKFYFNITTDEAPIFLTLQVRTEDPDHLRLIEQSWNWPYDAEGSMKDLDNSLRDLMITPWLRLTSNDIPDQQDVLTYGMIVTSNGWDVSLRPIWEYGTIVGLSGTMYHPSPPKNLSLQAELVWKVMGFSDVPLKALETGSGTYVTIGRGGVAVANTSQALEGGLELVNLGGNKTALRVPSGAYLSIANNGTLVANGSTIGARETFFLDNRSDNIGFKSSFNDKYLSVSGVDGVIIANSSEFVGFYVVDLGYYPELKQLVTYNDNFMLTGFSIEECHGTDIGLFYNDTKNGPIRACMLLDYVYCLNDTTTIWDIPAVLAEYNVTLLNYTESFPQKYQASFELATELIPTILNSLPENQTLPIIIILDDYSKMVDLSDVLNGSYVAGNSNFINMTGVPLIFSKSLKMNFYNTSINRQLIYEELFYEVGSWGLSYNTTVNLMTFVIHWYIGVQTVMSVGNISTMENPISIPFVIIDINVALAIGQAKLDLIGGAFIGAGLTVIELKATARMEKIYRQCIALAPQSPLAKLGITDSKLLNWQKIKIQDAMKSNKFFKTLKVASYVTLVIDIALSFYFAYNSIKSGWDTAAQLEEVWDEAYGSDYGTVYTILAVIGYGLLVYFTIGLFLLGTVLTAGMGSFILILVLTLFLVGFSVVLDWLISSLTGLIVGDAQDYFHATADIDIEGSPESTITDKDDNGLDVGDRIEVLTQLVGIITGAGSNPTLSGWSYIVPWIKISPPPGSRSNTSLNLKTSLSGINPWAWEANTPLLNRTSSTPVGSTKREDRYNSSAWIEPGFGMVNFPVKLQLNADYRLHQNFYNDWFGFIFGDSFREWHQKDNIGSTPPTTLTTLYYDVLPGSLTDFLSWKAITRNDYDGDGLNDTYEESLGVSNKWRYDTDSDGLNDKYEIEQGTDPSSCDTDQDGLIDKYEYVYATNATNKDADGDGLFDYLEVAGWIISFNYSGQLFQMRVFSNPALNDTDDDGISDGDEYWSGLNPRSADTNGDGVEDVAVSQDESVALLQYSIDIKNDIMNCSSWVTDISVDGEGYVYFPVMRSGYNDTVIKLYSNFTYYDNWTLGASPFDHYYAPRMVGIDRANEFIFIKGWNSPVEYIPFYLTKFNLDGTNPEPICGVIQGENDIRGIAIDSNGFIYTTEADPDSGEVGRINKYFPNGTYIESYGSFGPNPEQFKEIGFIDIDDKYGFIYVLDGDGISSTQRIMKFNKTNGSFITTLPNGYGKIVDIAIDSDGWVYILDQFDPELGEGCVRKFDHNGMEDRNFILTDINGTPPWLLVQYPLRIEVDPNKNIYILVESGSLEDHENPDNSNPRILKFKENITLIPPEIPNDQYDWDGDGLWNLAEVVGWNVSFVNNKMVTTLAVNSESLVQDTDFDGISDYNENLFKTNPRNPDTDGDGLSDLYEWELGSNITNDDTDGDNLTDSDEILIGSDPISLWDTDSDGLSDWWEFQLNSDPRKVDTDSDGANDSQEFYGESDLLDPDSDDDFMFDGLEYTLNCNPNNPDTDNDNLIDGEEFIHDTNATDPDTDDDGAIDGLEVDLWLDPLDPDCDDDNLLDGTELYSGSNPLNNDTDYDGVPDNLDNDTLLTFTAPVVVAFNPDPYDGNLLFAQNLALMGNVTIVSFADFMANHTDATYIVLVGRPASENNTLSGLIYNLTADTGTMRTAMMTPDSYQMMVRYGVWKSTQTVIILSQAYPLDYYKIFSELKSKNVTVLNNSVIVDYQTTPIFQTETAYNYGFVLDEIDSVKITDATLSVMFQNWTRPTIQLTKYNQNSIPYPLTTTNGLAFGEKALGKYIDVIMFANGSRLTACQEAILIFFIRFEDLDIDGNGYITDPWDINEGGLNLFYFDEITRSWKKLSTDLDWVLGIGVNTTDFELYGETFAGLIWVRVTNLSLFTAGGLQNVPYWNYILLFIFIALALLGASVVVYTQRKKIKVVAKKLRRRPMENIQTTEKPTPKSTEPPAQKPFVAEKKQPVVEKKAPIPPKKQPIEEKKPPSAEIKKPIGEKTLHKLELTDIPGIGFAKLNLLHKAEIRSIEDLINCDPKAVAGRVTGLGVQTLNKWIAQAKDLLQG